MQRIFLKSKLHLVTLTDTQLNYEGSISLDRNLLDEADILPGEQVHVLNANTGSRIVTYAIEGPPGSGMAMLNGPAAREGQPGDRVIVIAYCQLTHKEARTHRPHVVLVDEQNRSRS